METKKTREREKKTGCYATALCNAPLPIERIALCIFKHKLRKKNGKNHNWAKRDSAIVEAETLGGDTLLYHCTQWDTKFLNFTPPIKGPARPVCEFMLLLAKNNGCLHTPLVSGGRGEIVARLCQLDWNFIWLSWISAAILCRD